jgi:hypothetical protein
MRSDRRYPGEPRFPDLATIGRVESEVERDGNIQRETRYYVSSAALSAAAFGRVVRGFAVPSNCPGVIDHAAWPNAGPNSPGKGADVSILPKTDILTLRVQSSWT